MQSPKRWKFRKAQKGRISGGSPRCGRTGTVQSRSFGDVGLRAQEPGKVSARQLEATRRALRRTLKRKGRVWGRVFPAVPVTSKPSEVRRGKGKGSVSYWCARVRARTRLFEVGGEVPLVLQEAAVRAAGSKISLTTEVVRRRPVRKASL